MPPKGRKAQETPDRFCEGCGALLVRRRRPSGSLECYACFLARHFCGRACMATGQRQRRAKPR